MKFTKRMNALSKKRDGYWNYGNQILYELCKNNFFHNKDTVILTKVLFIGRIYAAAVERRDKKGDEINNETFYIKRLLPKLKYSRLDIHLMALRRKKLNKESIKK